MTTTTKITASVNRNSNPTEGRINLELRHDTDGCHRWYDEDGNDTEVSGPDQESAVSAARAAWGGPGWFLVIAQSGKDMPEYERGETT